MNTVRIRFNLFLTIVFVLFSQQSIASGLDESSEFQDLKKQIVQTCPGAWQGIGERPDFIADGDIWNSDLSDAASYVKFAAKYSVGGSTQIYSYRNRVAIIDACGTARLALLNLLKTEALALANPSIDDDDNDGVSNYLDQCSATLSSGTSLDALGCSYEQRDDDKDWVVNADDLCPESLVESAVDTSGCSMQQLQQTAEQTIYGNFILRPAQLAVEDGCFFPNEVGTDQEFKYYPKVMITTDLNKVGDSDPDDFQSLVHLLAKSNLVNIRGIISSPNAGHTEATRRIKAIIDAYGVDISRAGLPTYDSLAAATLGRYPTARLLKTLVYRGSVANPVGGAIPFDQTRADHRGAKAIVDEALAVRRFNDENFNRNRCQRLHVLVWGSIHDLKIALSSLENSDSPGVTLIPGDIIQYRRWRSNAITRVLRVTFIASTNRTNSQADYNYIRDRFLEKNNDKFRAPLWFVQSEATFRGMSDNLPIEQDSFVKGISNKSCMWYALSQAGKSLPRANGLALVKAGDTPSLLSLISPSGFGDTNDPALEINGKGGWGGVYKLIRNNDNVFIDEEENYHWWVDRSIAAYSDIPRTATEITGIRIGAPAELNFSSVSRYRLAFYKDWRDSMNKFPASSTSGCRAAVNRALKGA